MPDSSEASGIPDEENAGGNTINSATGENDPNGVWAWLQGVEKFGTAAANLVNAFRGNDNNNGNRPANSATPAATGAAAWKQYLPWIFGGVVLFLVVGLVFGRRR